MHLVAMYITQKCTEDIANLSQKEEDLQPDSVEELHIDVPSAAKISLNQEVTLRIAEISERSITNINNIEEQCNNTFTSIMSQCASSISCAIDQLNVWVRSWLSLSAVCCPHYLTPQYKMAGEQLMINYPNLNNKKLPLFLGCVSDTEEDQAMNAFQRTCFREVEITNVVGYKRNCEPSCIWRVCYKIKDRTPDYHEKGSETKKTTYICPLPNSDEELKQLFLDITKICGFIGMKVVEKQYCKNRELAVVYYSPIFCSCGVQDFNMDAEEPRMPPLISEAQL
ncbi:uncharacterized protein LOC123007460 isoform X2 [Tribolium madens]|uniref:uncharacterized protein LOC123007460 isoform X2 n=1 Tax=Tribolium madens TaxID=41895 RepID=UPI001CF74789|nr:uncharacterized protein LOC123007460 isoform X2 [Tribolium madens]